MLTAGIQEMISSFPNVGRQHKILWALSWSIGAPNIFLSFLNWVQHMISVFQYVEAQRLIFSFSACRGPALEIFCTEFGRILHCTCECGGTSHQHNPSECRLGHQTTVHEPVFLLKRFANIILSTNHKVHLKDCSDQHTTTDMPFRDCSNQHSMRYYKLQGGTDRDSGCHCRGFGLALRHGICKQSGRVG